MIYFFNVILLPNKEGEAEVKSLWSVCAGLHTFYNGKNKELQ